MEVKDLETTAKSYYGRRTTYEAPTCDVIDACYTAIALTASFGSLAAQHGM